MAIDIVINTKQKSTLQKIVTHSKTGKVIVDAAFDGRTINALEARGLVKITETKKGVFAVPTAKGRKLFN